MMKAKILIVEDEPAIQELLAFNVMQAGFHALRAEDADSAWHQIRGNLPDLILLDWMLPIPVAWFWRNRYELTHELKASRLSC